MKKDCIIYVAKTKALISFAVTAKLICVFVLAYAKSRFSHHAAHMQESRVSLDMNHILQNLYSSFCRLLKDTLLYMYILFIWIMHVYYINIYIQGIKRIIDIIHNSCHNIQISKYTNNKHLGSCLINVGIWL